MNASAPGSQHEWEACRKEDDKDRQILEYRLELHRINLLLQNITHDPRCQLCPQRWHWSWGHCYYFSVGLEENRKWAESAEYCIHHNASLVVIQENREKEFIMEKMRRFPVMPFLWIGLTDFQEEGQWLWQDGTALHNYTEESVQWNSEHRNCADLRGDGSLFAADCESYGPWLCEKPADNHMSQPLS
ncbi:C-type lectin domain family 12 member B-like [Chanos chanos]|uniref:C-type lectin domain family 12 member B-like n=1 Tax=Chanos chanos TaxID=29144 RepID=A0A6J2VHS7_CHACN|nr:C-type lectin domain family 12 member B-like [Chanos chanos]